MPRPTAKQTRLAERRPPGNLPEEKGQSVASSKHDYSVGDGVFWATASTAGEWTLIGHPRGDQAGKMLVLASSPEIGFKIEADQCSPAGWSDPQRGRE